MCNCSAPAEAASGSAAPADAVAFLAPDMTCGHCVAAIAAAFAEKLPGAPVEIDLASRTVRVAAPAEVAAAILADAGYPASRV